MLVGNKIDIIPRLVKTEKPFEWALKNNISYCEVSAKTGEGISTVMNEILNGLGAENKSKMIETMA